MINGKWELVENSSLPSLPADVPETYSFLKWSRKIEQSVVLSHSKLRNASLEWFLTPSRPRLCFLRQEEDISSTAIASGSALWEAQEKAVFILGSNPRNQPLGGYLPVGFGTGILAIRTSRLVIS